MKNFVFTLFVVTVLFTLTGCSNSKVPEPEFLGIGTIEKSPEGEAYVMVDSVKYTVSHIVKDNTVIPSFQGVKVTVFDLGNSKIEAFYGEVTAVQAYETLQDNAEYRDVAIVFSVIGFVFCLTFIVALIWTELT